MNFLLDTNILSEVMKRSPDPKVLRWFASRDRIIISAITFEELAFGLQRRALLLKQAWLKQMLTDKGEIVPVTDKAAAWSGERRALLESAGRMVTQADALIAACAWEKGLVLATRNTKDFQGLGIALVNPFE